MTYFQKKKRHFLSIVNSVKGFIRSISGTSPLMIEDCVDNDSIINYNILGKTTQDGGSNLLNSESNIQGFYIDKNGNLVEALNTNYSESIKVEPDTDYTLSFIVTIANANIRVHEFNSNNEWIRQKIVHNSAQSDVNNRKSVTFTISSDTQYVKISYNYTFHLDVQLKRVSSMLPSYDNCVDFESVGDLVTEYDGGKNLLNTDRNIQRFYINENGELIYSADCGYSEPIKVEPNTDYTLSFIPTTSGANIRVHEFDLDKIWVKQAMVYTPPTNDVDNRKSVTFTVSSDAQYVRVTYHHQRYFEVQLEKGSEATDYEPYHVEKYGKYKIPIVASGKNLLDLSGINAYSDYQRVRYTSENGYLKLNGNKYGTAYVIIKSGTEENPLLVLQPGTYTFSSRVISGTYTYNDIGIQLNTSYTLYPDKTIVFTLTEPLVITQIRAYIGKDNNEISNLLLAIQLEKSDQVTEFQPYFEPIETEIYLDEPLRQGMYYNLTTNQVVPYTGYEDYIDFESQKVIRKNVETELYLACNDYNGQGNIVSLQGRNITSFIKGSNRYRTLGCNYGNLTWSNNSCNTLYMGYANYGVSSKAELQQYFNDCALANKPVKVLYRRDTPVEIPIELPKLLSHKGDVTYTIGTTVAPEGMSATYYSYTNDIKVLSPTEYQLVEYIEGTGTQYIDTDFYPYDSKYIMTAKIKSSVVPQTTEDKYYRVFGNLSAENPSDTTLYRYQYRGYNSGQGASTDAVCCGTAVNNEARALYTWQNDTDYEITVDGINKTYSINDKTATYSGKAATYISQYSIKLFTVSATSAKDSMKFYNFKVKDESGNLVVDLYPCYRRSDNVIGMYDIIRNKFFVNAGTETFLKGENV